MCLSRRLARKPHPMSALPRRPIGIDLFSGAGGLSLGFEQAGFDVVAAVEIDPIHAAVHEYNFPRCKVLARSVADLTGREIRHAAALGNQDIDVLFGGAPCQGFSLIGHRALEDPRNSLVKEFVRLVAELSPKFVVFENVKGLTVGRHKQFLNEIVEALRGVGYHVRLPWRVLDAADFGVPQHRERLILLAAKKGTSLPQYPEPICRPADGGRDLLLPRGPNCADALDDLPDPETFPELTTSDAVRIKRPAPRSPYARAMSSEDEDGWHFAHPRLWNPSLLTASARTEHSTISRRRFEETACGAVEPISRFFKLSPEGLCNTLRAGTDSARGAFTSPRPIHYAQPRCITVREMARLHGFPDWFRFHPTKWHGARQIGNAVPPPLARAVAGALMDAAGHTAVRPSSTIPLGDESLLRLDMAAASLRFGIAVPIGRRDRKSGATKRKQTDIEAERLERSL